MSFGYRWKPYVPVAARRAQAERAIKKASKAGAAPQPVRIAGRAIAQNFWGKGWCQHMEAFSDFENRLPRGRTYVRNGSVWDLEIKAGGVEAQVMGSSLYQVRIAIEPLKPADWKTLMHKCSGGVGSLLELLQGRLSDQVMRVVTDRQQGLFPLPGEMMFSCSCPDWADMCKHVAATLYGVGNRLDQQPQLLFQLRGVDAAELIAGGMNLPQAAAVVGKGRLADDQLGAIFGIELDAGDTNAVPAPPRRAPKPAAKLTAPAGGKFRVTGKNITILRKKLGLSVAEFALRMKVAAASVRRWEASAGTLRLQRRSLAVLAELQLSVRPTRRQRQQPSKPAE